MNVAVTGAGGFIGQALCKYLSECGYQVIAFRRSEDFTSDKLVKSVYVGEYEDEYNLIQSLRNIDVVIHLAGRAHTLLTSDLSHLDINKRLAIRMVRCSKIAGVKRFIFISSIGVHGVSSKSVISEASQIVLVNSYCKSKYESELIIKEECRDSFMEFTIVRPPLVYSYNAPGNFSRMLKYIYSGLPILVNNRPCIRSFIALENLVQFIELCICHSAAANEVFLVSDKDSLSVSEIIDEISAGMSKRCLKISCSPSVLWISAKIINKEREFKSLYESLQINAQKAISKLGWNHVVPARTALRSAGFNYRRMK